MSQKLKLLRNYALNHLTIILTSNWRIFFHMLSYCSLRFTTNTRWILNSSNEAVIIIELTRPYRTKYWFHKSSTARIRDIHCMKLLLQLQVFGRVTTHTSIVWTKDQWCLWNERCPYASQNKERLFSKDIINPKTYTT